MAKTFDYVLIANPNASHAFQIGQITKIVKSSYNHIEGFEIQFANGKEFYEPEIEEYLKVLAFKEE